MNTHFFLRARDDNPQTSIACLAGSSTHLDLSVAANVNFHEDHQSWEARHHGPLLVSAGGCLWLGSRCDSFRIPVDSLVYLHDNACHKERLMGLFLIPVVRS